jgi:peptidoglycan/LPS O-acetylase OafA/YrhL
MTARANEWHDTYHTLPALFLWFGAGMALAVSSVWWTQREREWAPIRLVVDHPGWCWAVAALIFASACASPLFPRAFEVGGHSVASYTAQHLLYGVIAALILLPGIFGENAGGLPRWILSLGFMSWVGRISYGVFLWHHPLLEPLAEAGAGDLISGAPFASFAIALVPLSLLCGWLSYVVIEKPARRFRGGFRLDPRA